VPPAPGSLALSSSIWAALFLWVVAEWRRTAPASPTQGRPAWTLGAAAALVHAAVAFHVRHAWSHAAALADTARQTAAVIGWSSGIGLYVNYVFLAIWTADVLWWWLGARSFSGRPAWLDAAVRAFLWFMFVNGSFVFVAGPRRWLGLLATLAVLLAWYRGRGSRA
jgi:hypothetical protein